MASDRVQLEEGSLSTDLIAQQSFSTVRRGYDPDEVRAFLIKLASEILAMGERQADLEADLRSAEYRVAHPVIDEETILAAVGEGTAHILRSAHEAAADIKSRAEENASRILKEAHQKADALRAEAETVLARRTEEAEGVAARITENARVEAERLGDLARQQAKTIRTQSEAERQAMIDGAQATREKILTHLARKRKVAVVQVEQLLAGRERLLESYQVVRETLEEVTTELARAETAARAAADAIRLRPMAIDEPDTGENPVVGRDLGIDSIAGRLSTRDIEVRPTGRPPLPVADDHAAGAESPATQVPPAVASTPPGRLIGDRPVTADDAAPAPAPDAPPPSASTAGTATRGPSSSHAAAAPGGGKRGSSSTGSVGPPPAAAGVGQRDPQSPTAAVDQRDPSSPAAPGSRGSSSTGSATPPAGAAPAGKANPSTTASAAAGAAPAGTADTSPPGAAPAGTADTSPPGATGAARAGTRGPSSSGPVVPGAGTGAASSSGPGGAGGASTAGAPGVAPSRRQVPGAGRAAGTETGAAPAGDAATGSESQSIPPTTSVDSSHSNGAVPAAQSSVESLFARIREDREKAVAHARVVLGEQEPEGPAERPIPDADETLLQLRDEAMAPLEATLTRRLKRVLQDDQNDLLDRLRGLRTQATAAFVLPARSAQMMRFAAASLPMLSEAASAGASFVSSRLGQAAVGGEEPGSLDDLAAELANAIVFPLRRRLEEVFAAAAADDDRVALAESIGAAYREWKTQRLEASSADHIAAAYARGVFAATPARSTTRWLVEDVDGPCPDCDDNVLAGDVPKGEPYPTGQRHPPAHAGCRCLVVPSRA